MPCIVSPDAQFEDHVWIDAEPGLPITHVCVTCGASGIRCDTCKGVGCPRCRNEGTVSFDYCRVCGAIGSEVCTCEPSELF